jgi:hypothetical protein
MSVVGLAMAVDGFWRANRTGSAASSSSLLSGTGLLSRDASQCHALRIRGHEESPTGGW